MTRYARPLGRRCGLCPRYFWASHPRDKYCCYSCSHAAAVLYRSIHYFITYRAKHHAPIGGGSGQA